MVQQTNCYIKISEGIISNHVIIEASFIARKLMIIIFVFIRNYKI